MLLLMWLLPLLFTEFLGAVPVEQRKEEEGEGLTTWHAVKCELGIGLLNVKVHTFHYNFQVLFLYSI